MVEAVGGPDGLAKREVARQDDVFPPQGDEEGALHGPRADPGNRGELGDDLVVGQPAQDVRVQPAVGEALGEVAQRADLPPGEAGLAERGRVDPQQFGGCGEPPVEQGLDAGQGPAGRGDGQLLAGDLEQQRAVQVHRRQLGQPRARSKSGRSSMSRASTGSASRRWERACASHAVRPGSVVMEPAPCSRDGARRCRSIVVRRHYRTSDRRCLVADLKRRSEGRSACDRLVILATDTMLRGSSSGSIDVTFRNWFGWQSMTSTEVLGREQRAGELPHNGWLVMLARPLRGSSTGIAVEPATQRGVRDDLRLGHR